MSDKELTHSPESEKSSCRTTQQLKKSKKTITSIKIIKTTQSLGKAKTLSKKFFHNHLITKRTSHFFSKFWYCMLFET